MHSALTTAFKIKTHTLFSLHVLLKLLWPSSCAWLQASGALTEATAKQLLLQWQHVKADALGNHAVVASPLRASFLLCVPICHRASDKSSTLTQTYILPSPIDT